MNSEDSSSKWKRIFELFGYTAKIIFQFSYRDYYNIIIILQLLTSFLPEIIIKIHPLHHSDRCNKVV